MAHRFNYELERRSSTAAARQDLLPSLHCSLAAVAPLQGGASSSPPPAPNSPKAPSALSPPPVQCPDGTFFKGPSILSSRSCSSAGGRREGVTTEAVAALCVGLIVGAIVLALSVWLHRRNRRRWARQQAAQRQQRQLQAPRQTSRGRQTSGYWANPSNPFYISISYPGPGGTGAPPSPSCLAASPAHACQVIE